jgi:hypothetical protein
MAKSQRPIQEEAISNPHFVLTLTAALWHVGTSGQVTAALRHIGTSGPVTTVPCTVSALVTERKCFNTLLY